MDHPMVVMCQDCSVQLRREPPWWHPAEYVWLGKLICPGCGAVYVLNIVQVVRKERRK